MTTFLLLFSGLTMAVIQGGYVRRVPLSKTKATTVIGLWIIIPSFVAVGLAKSAGLLYFGLFLFALCKYLLNILSCLNTIFWKSKTQF